MRLERLPPKHTAAIFTHVQPWFDATECSVAAAQRLIDSRKGGAVYEHRAMTFGELLVHQGVVHFQLKASDFALVGLPRFRRFMFCGGGILLPSQFYTYKDHVTGAEVVPSSDKVGRCHYYSFVDLVWSLDRFLTDSDPVEVHFCIDALYSSHWQNTAEGDKLLIYNPPYDPSVLDQYKEFLRGMRMPYTVYFGGEKVLEAPNPKLLLFIWKSVDDLLAVLPEVPVESALTT
ncbi:MAG: hypothetical protein NT099_01570 [Candidatus Saganbacteria bacterium]|nr:hypothetical protein [Candidatus Saganbacteria bacterium]